MDATEFIVGLMKENTDALGFIPRPAIVKQFTNLDRFIIQRNRFRKAIGYLLHGPVHPDGRLIIHQACIRLDKRNSGFGRQVLLELLCRAARGRAKRIDLRCAWDLDAVTFWYLHKFNPTAVAPGGRRRRRTIIHFSLEIQQAFPRAIPKQLHASVLRFPSRVGELPGHG